MSLVLPQVVAAVFPLIVDVSGVATGGGWTLAAMVVGWTTPSRSYSCFFLPPQLGPCPRWWLDRLRLLALRVGLWEMTSGLSPYSALSLVRQRIHAVRQSTRLSGRISHYFLVSSCCLRIQR